MLKIILIILYWVFWGLFGTVGLIIGILIAVSLATLEGDDIV